MFGSRLLSSTAIDLVGIFIYSQLAVCWMLYVAVLKFAIIVSIYCLLVESWILDAASCYVMMVVMY